MTGIALAYYEIYHSQQSYWWLTCHRYNHCFIFQFNSTQNAVLGDLPMTGLVVVYYKMYLYSQQSCWWLTRDMHHSMFTIKFYSTQYGCVVDSPMTGLVVAYHLIYFYSLQKCWWLIYDSLLHYSWFIVEFSSSSNGRVRITRICQQWDLKNCTSEFIEV